MAEGPANSGGPLPQSWRPTLPQLCRKLRSISDGDKLIRLMMNLNIEYDKLKEISDENYTVEAQRRAAFDYWLRQTPDASWNHIIDALRHSVVGEVTLAEELKKEHQWKEPRAKSMRTYIQADYKDQLIKVTPSDKEFCETHLKKPAVSHRYYTVIPGRPTRTPASPDKVNRPIPWIQEDIQKYLMMFLRRIEEYDRKDDFRVGYEARFGRQYLMLQEGSENLKPATVTVFKPDLRKHNKKEFHLKIGHDVQPVVDRYCISAESRQINVIDPFKFVMEGQEEGLYIAVIEEVKHGVFLLKAVYRQPTDQTNSASYDILRPGRGYDIRIGDNCGPLVPVTRDSLSYRLAEDLTAGMKRKRPDKSQLSFMPRGETSKRESKYFVRYFRQKMQTQYPWKGNKWPWILAKYEVDTFKDVFNMEDANKKFPEVKEYDFDFNPKQHKQELELWNEKIYPKDADKTRPSRDEYLHMQSCATPLFLPGEGEPVPPRPWTTEELMKDFGEFLQAAFDVADTLEKSPLLKKDDKK